MARFSLGDRQSSTVLATTDSLTEIQEIVDSILADDGPGGFDGLSLSVFDDTSGRHVAYDDDQVLPALQAINSNDPPTPLIVDRLTRIAHTGF